MERSMKKTIIAIIVALFPLLANAQEQYADSIVYRPAAAVDSTLLGNRFSTFFPRILTVKEISASTSRRPSPMR